MLGINNLLPTTITATDRVDERYCVQYRSSASARAAPIREVRGSNPSRGIDRVLSGVSFLGPATLGLVSMVSNSDEGERWGGYTSIQAMAAKKVCRCTLPGLQAENVSYKKGL